MPPTAITTFEPEPEGLEFYRLRDELTQHYQPTNAHEKLLVSAVAQAWLRLQRAQSDEDRLSFEREAPDYREAYRRVAECERAWRRSIELIERERRRRGASAYSRKNPWYKPM